MARSGSVLDDEDRRSIGVVSHRSPFRLSTGTERTTSGTSSSAAYASELIERESHLLETCRYIVLNPVRAGICRQPGRWRWSSYRATAGYVQPPAFLAADWVLGQFGNTPRQAALRYVEFVADGVSRDRPIEPCPGAWP